MLFDELRGKRLGRLGVDAAVTQNLFVFAGAGSDELAVGRAVDGGFRRRSLPAEESDAVGELLMTD